MACLKLSNNPCKFCNGEIDEGKPLCGDIVNTSRPLDIETANIDSEEAK